MHPPSASFPRLSRVVPLTDADVERFADAGRNLLIHAMSDPLAQKAFLDGLQAPDPKERRLWWRMAREFGLGRPTGVDEDGAPQFGIVNNVNHAPRPPHADGPVDAPAPQPFGGRIADRVAGARS